MKEENKILFIYILILGCVLLFSCQPYPVSKAIMQVNKANDTYPATVAEMTRKWYPCITTKSDTTVLVKDSVIYIECPEITPIPASDYVGTDTVIQVKTVRVPVNLPVRYVTIKEKIEDSAKIKVMQAELDSTKEKVRLYTDKYDKKVREYLDEKDKRQRNGWQRNWLILIIAAYVTLRVLKGVAKNATPAGFIGRVAKGILKFII